MKFKPYVVKTDAKDVREQGRIVLAHGEVTGHCHEIVSEAVWRGALS